MTNPTISRVRPLLPVVGADQEVPLVQGGSTRYANLDVAASAPALTAVEASVHDALRFYASVHRGAGYLSQASTAAYENARDVVRRFVGAPAGTCVVFTRNTTDSLNLLASAVPTGTSVLVLDVEHHANLLPWRGGAVTTLVAASTIAETVQRLASELAARPYSLLAVTGMSNVTGERLPLRALADLAHAHGARIAVDGAQLVPHHGVDLAAEGIDYLSFSGHKLYAPFGVGVLVGAADWLDAAPAYLAGGGAVRQVGLSDVDWHTGAQRHEGGSPNTVGVHALAAACRVLKELGSGQIAAHERALHDLLVDGLAQLDGVSVARIWSDSEEPSGIVTFTVEGYAAGLVAAYLSAEHGIGVRDGRFCAHPLLARLGFDDGAVRVSVGLNTSSEDVDRLLAALDGLTRLGPSWRYATIDGVWQPLDDPRSLPAYVGGGLLSESSRIPCQP
jgi:selenocysteine lyase/cysteine desulfurase